MAIKTRGVNRFDWRYRTSPNGAAPPGISVTPGTSNGEGSWTEIASAANIAHDVYGVRLRISGGNTNGQAKEHLLDLGWDPAGGTSYVEQVSNMPVGASGTWVASGSTVGSCRDYYFPLRIPSGAAVAVRIQGSNATAGTVIVDAVFYGMPSRPDLIRVGQYAETIGTITNSSGVTFTPGNQANGTWVSLGTTTRKMWWWQLFVQNNTGSTPSLNLFCDLAWGDGSNKHLIIEGLPVVETTGEAMASWLSFPDGFAEVPAGATIYVRGNGSGSSSGTHNAVAVGIGG